MATDRVQTQAWLTILWVQIWHAKVNHNTNDFDIVKMIKNSYLDVKEIDKKVCIFCKFAYMFNGISSGQSTHTDSLCLWVVLNEEEKRLTKKLATGTHVNSDVWTLLFDTLKSLFYLICSPYYYVIYESSRLKRN